MLSALGFLLCILIGWSLMARPGLGDVGLCDSWSLALRLRLSILLFFVVEEERYRVQLGRRVFGEDCAVRGAHTNRVNQNERIRLALLVLRLGVFEVLETRADNERHAVF